MNSLQEPTFPFEIGACYGENAEPLVDHIILAEFDIDSGRYSLLLLLVYVLDAELVGEVDSTEI